MSASIRLSRCSFSSATASAHWLSSRMQPMISSVEVVNFGSREGNMINYYDSHVLRRGSLLQQNVRLNGLSPGMMIDKPPSRRKCFAVFQIPHSS